MRSNNATTKSLNGTAPPEPSPTPAIGKAQTSPPSEPASTIDEWVQGMIQTMNGLSENPELLSRLRKRSF